MKIGSWIVIGVALLTAASSTQAGSHLQGGNTNGSQMQGASTNGSNLQGGDTNGSNLQGGDTNGSNVQGQSPNGMSQQGQHSHGADRPRPEPRSTGVRLPAVHVVGGRLFTGDAPARARGR